MRIKYLAHASFLITASDGTRIITDPYNEQVGYRMPGESADIVTSSHEHFDHNHFTAVNGSFEKIVSTAEKIVKGIKFRGVATAHDEEGGRQRGRNIIFLMEVDGIRIAHLGDLGHALTDEQLKEIGPVDVLLSPVGGHFTIDAKVAKKVVDGMKPLVVIPMHYKTTSINFPIAPVDDFTRLFSNVKRPGASETELSRETLPSQTEITVLEPSCL